MTEEQADQLFSGVELKMNLVANGIVGFRGSAQYRSLDYTIDAQYENKSGGRVRSECVFGRAADWNHVAVRDNNGDIVFERTHWDVDE